MSHNLVLDTFWGFQSRSPYESRTCIQSCNARAFKHAVYLASPEPCLFPFSYPGVHAFTPIGGVKRGQMLLFTLSTLCSRYRERLRLIPVAILCQLPAISVHATFTFTLPLKIAPRVHAIVNALKRPHIPQFRSHRPKRHQPLVCEC